MENTNAPLRAWAFLLFTTPRNAGGPSSYALERLVGIKHHRVRAIQAKLKNSPFAACWKAELEKAGITHDRLLDDLLLAWAQQREALGPISSN